MRIGPLLTGLLAHLHRRQTYNNGQYSVIPTLVSWTPSYYTSYLSTQLVTITTLVPCPVFTSYTTVTQCANCCAGCGPTTTTPITTPVVVGGLVCVPKTCSTRVQDVIDYSSTPYGFTEYAPATLNGVLNPQTTFIAASSCTSYQPFANPGYNAPGIVPCGGGGGGGAIVSPTTTDAGTCGASVVTYTYTTNGATVVVATNIQSHCGPFKLTGGANRIDGNNAQLLFWIWSIAAILSGIGMILL